MCGVPPGGGEGVNMRRGMMLEYMIIEAMNPKTLIKIVSDKMQQGWRPQGGVTVTVIVNHEGVQEYEFYQAMTREKPLDNG